MTTRIAADVVTLIDNMTAIAMTISVACAVNQWVGAQCIIGVVFSWQVVVASVEPGAQHIHL